MTRPLPSLALCVLTLAASQCAVLAQSAPHIRITGTGSGKSSLSVAGVQADGSEATRMFLQVLKDNLQRSGWFQLVEGPSAGILVRGRVQGGGGVSAGVTVEWLPSGRFEWSRSGTAEDIRPLAHSLSDEIVKRVTGKPGMASAPVLMVGRRGGRTDIYLCDADGGRLRAVTPDGKTCLSPTWLPDRSGFLYTAFLRGIGEIYRVNLGAKSRRDVLARFPGLNMGAVASPDGSLAAMVLSASGNVELYVMNLSNRRLTRLTTTAHANESSPNWSPDGAQIAYVSDAGGSPQLHTMHKDSRQGKRLVFGLAESVAPDWGPDGRIAFCGRQEGRYGVFVTKQGGAFERASPADGADYEDPSWAPDARHIVATRTAGGRRRLVVLDTMGDRPVELLSVEGDWYLADWSK